MLTYGHMYALYIYFQFSVCFVTLSLLLLIRRLPSIVKWVAHVVTLNIHIVIFLDGINVKNGLPKGIATYVISHLLPA